MGELAATLSAWDSEFNKALKSLPALGPDGERKSTWLQGTKLIEQTAYFFHKVPLKSALPRLIELAKSLDARKVRQS